jgi:very-short-patch-repair endonuclease
VQVRITDQHGDMFADFLWRKAGLVGEVDGEVKYESRDVLVAERRREARLRSLGWRIVRWEGAEIRRSPGQVMRRVAMNIGG